MLLGTVEIAVEHAASRGYVGVRRERGMRMRGFRDAIQAASRTRIETYVDVGLPTLESGKRIFCAGILGAGGQGSR